MSLVMTEEQDKPVEAEKGNNPVPYEEISPASTGADAHHQFLWHESPTQAHRLREAPRLGRGKNILIPLQDEVITIDKLHMSPQLLTLPIQPVPQPHGISL
jgi:hypothetical protein